MTGKKNTMTRLGALLLGCAGLGVAGGCASQDRSIPRPKPGQLVDVDEARAATAAGEWRTAAALWNELFLRGGGEERVEACLQTARALAELEEYESARAVIDLGLRRDENNADLLEMKGDVLAAMGFRRAAEAAYASALEVDPDRPSALVELARIRIALGREHLALESLRHRLTLGEVDAQTYLLRARALAACNQPAAAYNSFVKAFELGVDDPMTLLSAACLSFDERLQSSEACRLQSMQWLRTAIESDPQLTLAHFYLGVMVEEEGDAQGALAHYRRAVETDPGHGPSLTRLAVALSDLGHGEQAAEVARRALEYEKDPDLRERLKRLARP